MVPACLAPSLLASYVCAFTCGLVLRHCTRPDVQTINLFPDVVTPYQTNRQTHRSSTRHFHVGPLRLAPKSLFLPKDTVTLVT